ncbi:MAG: hypothetical protein J6C93_06575 [Clostridia bacterium]|nr:hypothetical protein [Clostridia bacterium]
MNGLGRGTNKENKENRSFFTRETVGMTLLLFSAIAFLIAVTRSLMFGEVGIAITGFLLGVFGYLTYPILILLIYTSVVMVFGKKLLPTRWVTYFYALLAVVFLIVHLGTSVDAVNGTYGEYLVACYTAGEGGITTCTGGGIVYALVVYPFRALLSVAGAFVVFSFLVALTLFLIVRKTPLFEAVKRRAVGGEKQVRKPQSTAGRELPQAEGVRAYPAPITFDDLPQAEAPKAVPVQQERTEAGAPKVSEYRKSREILFSTDPASSYRDNLIFDRDSRFNSTKRRSTVTPTEGETPTTYLSGYSERAEEVRESMPRRVVEPTRPRYEEGTFRAETPTQYDLPQIEAPAPSYRASQAPAQPVQERDYYKNDVAYEEEYSSAPNVSDYEDEIPDLLPEEEPVRELPAEQVERVTPSSAMASDIRSLFSSSQDTKDKDDSISGGRIRPVPTEQMDVERGGRIRGEQFSEGLRGERRSVAGLFDSEEPELPEETETTPLPESGRRLLAHTMAASATPKEEEKPAPKPQKHVYKAYNRPSIELFRQSEDKVDVPQEEIDRNSAIIVETLDGFHVDAEVVKVTCGSSVTRYDIDIPRNITVNTVIKRDEEIAMRLHARDGVNMYANRESGAISIEVPNAKRATVGVRSVMNADDYVNAKPTALAFVMGKDVEGRDVCGDIVKMKHVLVAGSTGSGKSVCLNALLVSLICKYSPEDLRLILIDPKKVEFAVFDGLPHLMINEIIADAQKAVTALNWAIKEMERRYSLFEQKTRDGSLVHNIDDYNTKRTEDEDKLAKIVIVVDELADLMSVAKKDIEERIQRLAQKARAAGIHLVIATQRPSVDVITGVIKGNLPTRLAFRVIQEVDSRTILDESGAEKLLGYGDMLYRTEGMFSCKRVQGAFLTTNEIESVVKDIKANNEAYFDESVADFINSTNQTAESSGAASDADGSAADPQYIKALGIVVKLGQASISLIQRKCSVGYNHAGKIIEWMEVMGYISPFDGKAKARTVLLTPEEYESKYGSLD